MKDDIVIVSAARTPVGAFNGAFARLPAHELGQGSDRGSAQARRSRRRAGFRGHSRSDSDRRPGPEPSAPGFDQRPAFRSKVQPGGSISSAAPGLRAVALGYQAILNGDSEIVVAGGQESMSQAPHCAHLRGGVKMGSLDMVDTMIKDGLWDAFNGYHMGNTAENVARQWQITRAQQDEFAVASQNKAEAAQKRRTLQGRDRAGNRQDAQGRRGGRRR